MAGKDAAALVMEREPLSPHGCVVAAKGQIDLYSAPAFKTALLQALDDGMTEIVVDLSQVDFMDSTGLGVLVGVSKRLQLMSGSLALVSSDETIQRVFEISGLATRFPMYDDRKLAAAAVDEA